MSATFKADLCAGSLMLPESRRVATLLQANPTTTEWNHAIKVENILQKRTPSAAIRIARLIRMRLEPMGPQSWALVAAGERAVAVQVLMAAAIHHSTLLTGFMRSFLGPQHRRLERQLSMATWDSFLDECAAVDPAVAKWSVTTRAKLRQVILRILVEGGYLESRRSMLLRVPHLHPEVVQLLRDNDLADVLAIMELRV